MANLNAMYRWKPKLTLGGGMERAAYKFGGRRYGANVSGTILLFKGSTLTFRVYRGHIHKLWGYQSQKVWEGSLQLLVRW